MNVIPNDSYYTINYILHQVTHIAKFFGHDFSTSSKRVLNTTDSHYISPHPFLRTGQWDKGRYLIMNSGEFQIGMFSFYFYMILVLITALGTY